MPTVRVELTNDQFEYVDKIADDAECSASTVIQMIVELTRTGKAKDAAKPMSVPRMKDRELLLKVLVENDGNVSETARELGEHRRTIQRKLIRYGISPSEYRRS